MNAILRIEAQRRRSYLAAASLVIMAWLILAIWSLSPYAEWLDHSRIEDIPAPLTTRLAVFAIGWALMIVAMMLPGTLLLLAHCAETERLNLRRSVPVILAYIGSWMLFGSLNYLGDSVLHEIVERVPDLAIVVAPSVLLLAGVYQLTPLKRACLSRCRPDGTAFKMLSARNSWAVGLQHGVFCLGSCWALMLLMFAIGGVNLIWMLLLGGIMAAERTLHRSHFLTRSLGFALILGSFLILLLRQIGM
jgi:predicted metal-binding membrane protein